MSGIETIPSTNARLLSHTDRLEEIRRWGVLRPITVHLAPTDRCNLNCEWCSTRNRGKNELSLEDCKKVVDTYCKLGAKSFELTGGGDPLMYDDLEELISYIYSKGRAIGLITNGLLLSDLSVEAIKKLTWMRISLSGLDFGLEREYMKINPKRISTFLGCSYVITRDTTVSRIDAIERVSKHLGAEYVRMVPNCYSTREIEWTRKYGPRLIKGMDNFFLQIKNYRTPEMCYWRYIKPFVNADGWIYQCSTCSLFAGKFPEHWRVAKIDDIESIYNGSITSFDTSPCSLCFYSDQNQLIHALLTSNKIKHGEFV